MSDELQFIILIVCFIASHLLNAFDATGAVSLFTPFSCSLCCSQVAPLSLLRLWCGKVPDGVLGTLPHRTHQPSEAHVLGFLQPAHQPLLHNGYELLITKLSIS